MEILTRRFCAQHADRLSHAMCMSCRKAICQECATQWEGINYCAVCLAVQRQPKAESSIRFSLVLIILAILALGFGLVRLSVGLGAFVAGMF